MYIIYIYIFDIHVAGVYLIYPRTGLVDCLQQVLLGGFPSVLRRLWTVKFVVLAPNPPVCAAKLQPEMVHCRRSVTTPFPAVVGSGL